MYEYDNNVSFKAQKVEIYSKNVLNWFYHASFYEKKSLKIDVEYMDLIETSQKKRHIMKVFDNYLLKRMKTNKKVYLLINFEVHRSVHSWMFLYDINDISSILCY